MASSTVVRIVFSLPACPPHAMFALVISGMIAASVPAPSPRSLLKSIEPATPSAHYDQRVASGSSERAAPGVPSIAIPPGPSEEDSGAAQRPTPAQDPRRGRRLDEQRSENERERREELDEDVQARAGGVFERVSDSVADNGRGMRRRALAEHSALLVFQHPRLDVLLRVVPRATTVIENGGEDDAGHRADHQQSSLGLGLQQNADDDRRADREESGRDHVAQRGRGRDVDD